MKISKIIISLALSTIVITGCGDQSKKTDDKITTSSSVANKNKVLDNKEYEINGNLVSETNHNVKGDFKIKDGKLSLSNFSTDEGPDLYVYISKGKSIENAKQISKIDLESKEQTFELNNIDAENFDTVLIYCRQAKELFGTGSYNDQISGKSVSFSGSFKGLNDKLVKGDVEVSNKKLTLSNFSTDEGPDLHVYLMKDDNINDSIELGKLDLDTDSQSFSIPNDIQLESYKKVGIYCNEAHVFFGESILY